MSGEKKIEISNQSVINAAIGMTNIQNPATLASNIKLPSSPGRLLVILPTPEIPETFKEAQPKRQTVNSPSSVEGMEGRAHMHSDVKDSSHGVHQTSPRQQYPPGTTVLNSIQAGTSSVKSYNSRDEFYRGEGLAASLQARVLAPPIKEETDMFNKRRANLHQTVLPNISSYHNQINDKKAENREGLYKWESPKIHGPICTDVKKNIAAYITTGRRVNFVANISPEQHSNTTNPLIDEIQQQLRPRERKEEGDDKMDKSITDETKMPDSKKFKTNENLQPKGTVVRYSLSLTEHEKLETTVVDFKYLTYNNHSNIFQLRTSTSSMPNVSFDDLTQGQGIMSDIDGDAFSLLDKPVFDDISHLGQNNIKKIDPELANQEAELHDKNINSDIPEQDMLKR